MIDGDHQQGAGDFWTPAREEAYRLLAHGHGRRTKEAIARQVGISRRQLFNWRRHPRFAARMDARCAELLGQIGASIGRERCGAGIAQRSA